MTNLTITFNAASTGNNFVRPDIALSYDEGTGQQFIARWGTGFSPNTTYTAPGGYDYQPPLDPEHVIWFACTQTLAAVNGPAVKFRFDAEFVNGGYVLIDDLVISGVMISTGIIENLQNNAIVIFLILFKTEL